MSTSLSRLAVFAALFSASCFPSPDFRFEQREISLRYVPEKDELLLLEVQRGLKVSLEKAEVLQGLVEGRRRYPPQGGMFNIDIDEEIFSEEREKVLERLEEDPKVEDALALRALDLLESVEVLEAGLFKENGTLCFYRLSRKKGAAACVQLLNDTINFGFLEANEGLEQEGRDPEEFERKRTFFGSRISLGSWERWEERARLSGSWVELHDEGVRISLPMNGREAAKLTLIAIEAAHEVDQMADLLQFLSEVRASDGEVVISFQPPAKGFFKVEDHTDDYEEFVTQYETKGKLHDMAEEDLEPTEGEYFEVLSTLRESVGFVEFDRAALLERFGYANAPPEPR